MPVATWFEDLPRTRLIAEYSLWSADLARFEDDIRRTDPYVDIYHIDVADGHFAPSLCSSFRISWPGCGSSPNGPSMSI